MDRGVIVGGGLIAASFLVAVLLNRSAHHETPPAKLPRDVPMQPCEQARQGAPDVGTVPADPVREDCEQLPAQALKR